MPGRDKPLITRNGIPDPQAYNPQTGQWESFIGVSWGKTAGGLYVPIRVDDQGRQEVTLSGNVVEVHTLVNALAIVDTNMRTANISDVVPNRNSYARFEFYVRNTLDSDIRIGFGHDHGFLAAIPGKSGSSIPYTPVSISTANAFHVVPPTLGAGSRPLSWYPIANPDVLDPLAYQKFVDVSGGSNLVYKAATAPTTGSLSIWFVGWKA
jgi:hypothetical protein